MTCREFEIEVKRLADDLHYIEHAYKLGAVSHLLRQRFVDTLRMGFDLPETFDIIQISSRLPDLYFFRFLKFQKNKKRLTILL